MLAPSDLDSTVVRSHSTVLPMSREADSSAAKRSTTGKKAQQQLDNKFLTAWNDPVAGVSCFSAGICTENLYGDGHRLLVADEDGTLKVCTTSPRVLVVYLWKVRFASFIHRFLQIWSGQTRETEQPLLESPVAITAFHVQDQAEKRLAIAAGANVYIFIGTKPHFKATMPVASVDEQDLAVWYVLHCKDGPCYS